MHESPSTGGCCRMRKYYQLILLILSAISILCFVFYKHEYDRLRKVLEVLDFFGTPTVTELGDNALVPLKECRNGSVEFIPDLWRLYEDEIYVYSSFQTANEKGWSINTLTLAGKDSAVARKRASCALLSGDGTADDRFEGTIEWKKIGNDTHTVAYSVICNVPEMLGNSHLVSIYDDKSTIQLNVPLHLGLDPTKSKEAVRSVSVCTFSPEPFWQAVQVVDFILYYEALGVNNVYLYHRGIGDHVITALKALVLNRSNLTIHLASWNRPTSPMDLLLIHHDCAWRHGTAAGPVIALPMSHYLVLPMATDLAGFLDKVSGQGEKNHVYEARIARQSLCSNPPNVEASPPSRLTRMMKNPSNNIPRAVVRWTEGVPNGFLDSVKISKIDSHSAKILTFEPCSITPDGSPGKLEKTDDDPAIRRFQTLSQRIPFYKV